MVWPKAQTSGECLPNPAMKVCKHPWACLMWMLIHCSDEDFWPTSRVYPDCPCPPIAGLQLWAISTNNTRKCFNHPLKLKLIMFSVYPSAADLEPTLKYNRIRIKIYYLMPIVCVNYLVKIFYSKIGWKMLSWVFVFVAQKMYYFYYLFSGEEFRSDQQINHIRKTGITWNMCT